MVGKLQLTKNKYNVGPAEHRTRRGIVFASIREANRYDVLRLLEETGNISDLELQPAFRFAENGRACFTYRADFRYLDNGRVVIEDCKGVRTPVYRLKKKLIEARFGIEILET
jgi:ribosomal protein S8